MDVGIRDVLVSAPVVGQILARPALQRSYRDRNSGRTSSSSSRVIAFLVLRRRSNHSTTSSIPLDRHPVTGLRLLAVLSRSVGWLCSEIESGKWPRGRPGETNPILHRSKRSAICIRPFGPAELSPGAVGLTSAPPFLWLAASQRIKRKQDLSDLAPESCLISA